MKRTSSRPKKDREVILRAANLSNAEARILVANYYRAQELRKRADMQIRHFGESAAEDMPEVLSIFGNDLADTETDIKRALKVYAQSHPVGRWAMAQLGVGEVIAAGLLAHIDIEQAETVGAIWRFAGLDPSCKWKKGEKRPFNRELRQICWHMGQCFKRVSNNPDSFYGRLYRERKELLVERNEAGFNAERAKTFMTKSSEVRAQLAKGKLPAGNLDSQACNYAAKIFLSHFHAVWFWEHFKVPPPKPFALSILGHAHEIKIPDTDMFPEFYEAYYGTPKRTKKSKRPQLETA